MSKATPSWKQKRALPPPGTASLNRRRTLATAALGLTVLLVALVTYWLYSQRNQETVLLLVGKTADENQFAVPPARYVEQTWTRLLSGWKAPHFHATRVSQLSENLDEEGLSASITQAIKPLQRNDALIVWVQGTGIVHAEAPVIVGDTFRLNDAAESGGSVKSLIRVQAILESMANWPGPKLLMLDWGQEVFDPRIGLMANNFVAALDQVVQKQAVKRGHQATWVLVSHLPGQLSLADANDRRTLFARAISEGLLVEPRRLPASDNLDQHPAALPEGAAHLNVSNLFEYVARRVAADSQQFQQPWLLKTGTGLLKSNADGWSGADRSPLIALSTKTGLPIGAPAPPKAKPADQADKNKESNTEKTPEPNSADKPALAGLDIAQQPPEFRELYDAWKQLEELRRPQAELSGWSEAALAPLAAKDIATRLLYLELRYFAGSQNVADAITNLKSDWAQSKRSIVPPPNTVDGEVDPTKRQQFLTSYEQLQTERQWAWLYLDALKLLASNKGVESNLNFDSQKRSQIESLLTARQPQAALDLLRAEVDRLIAQVRSALSVASEINRGQATAVSEILLRSSILTADQRLALRDFQRQVQLRADTDGLHGERSLTQPKINAVAPLPWNEPTRDLSVDFQSLKGLAIDKIAQVDPRDLCVAAGMESPWKRLASGAEFPDFPQPPETLKYWQVEWDRQGAALASNGEAIRLDSAIELTLVLKATDNSLPFPTLRLNPNHLTIVIDQKRYEPGAQLERSWFKQQRDTYRLVMKVVKNEESTSSETLGSLSLTSTSPGIRKLPGDLAFDLPVDDPVQLYWAQRLVVDGVPQWKSLAASSRFTLAPFAGRESKFQFAVQNIDSRAHEITLNLFVFSEEPSGAFGVVQGSTNLDGRKPTFTWTEKIKGNDKGLVKFASTAEAPANPATPPPGAPATPVAAPTPAASYSVAGGLAVQMLVDDRPAKTYWVSLRPRKAAELLEGKAQMENGKNLRVQVRWRDVNGDGRADQTPDNLAEQPLKITWDPLPWRRNNENIMAGNLMLAGDQATWSDFTSPGLKISAIDEEVWLDVDETPRSLIYVVRRDSTTAATRSQDRMRSTVDWRSYVSLSDGKPGMTYVPFTPPPSEKNMVELKRGGSAVFPDLKSIIEVRLAIDLPDPNSRFNVHLAQVPKMQNARDRQLSAQLKIVEDRLLVQWTEKDQQVSFDFSRDQRSQDQSFPLSIISDAQTPLSLPAIQADFEPPEKIRAQLLTGAVTLGGNTPIDIRLRAEDLSGTCIVKSITAQAEGQPPKPLIAEPIELVSGQSLDRKLDVSLLLQPTQYKLALIVSDRFDHNSKAIPFDKPLRISAPLNVGGPGGAGAPAFVGNLKVVAKLNEGRAFRNTAEFKIDPDQNKVQRKDGDKDKITYQEVKAGSYKVTVKYSEASANYEGEKTIVIAKEEDLQREWTVDLKKKE